MKNLYKLFFCLLFFNVNSQNDLQNANWSLFDRGGLNFSGNGPYVVSPIATNIESINSLSTSSVSDREGNLLFYTDGHSVWNGNNNLVQNGAGLLFQGGDYTQNIVIIPNPLDIDRYYIVSISSGQFDFYGPNVGLIYSEVDMSNGIGEVILANRNTPLLDNNNIPIDENRPINYGKITSAAHDNGIDYWLIAEVGTQIFVYLVDGGENGFTLVNTFNSPLNNINYIQPNGSDFSSANGPLKISPNNDALLIGYAQSLLPSNFPEAGVLFTAEFDDLNGNIFNFFQLQVPTNSVGLLGGAEYSPNGQVVHELWLDHAVSSSSELLLVFNPITRVWEWVQGEPVVEISEAGNILQRSRDGLIYFNYGSQIGHIDNPNDLTAQFVYTPVNVGSQNPNFAFGLPQWVQNQNCIRTLTTSNQITASLNQERNNWIRTSNEIIGNTTRVVYHAGDFVELIPGFETSDNSQFSAYIEGCSNDFQYRPATSKQSKDIVTTSQLNQTLKNITIYPNPSSNTIEIKSDNEFTKVTIVSLEGRIVYDKENDKTNSLKVDVSGFANGVYIVNVLDDNGKLSSQKLIKN
jgi:hypothetical protein